MTEPRRIPRSACRIAALLAGAWLVAAPLHAADPAPASRKGNVLSINGGKPTGKLLTREQLRSCLKQQAALKEQSALDADKAEIARLDGELARAEEALAAERATVDATNAAAVDAFNAKLHHNGAQKQQRNQRVADYNAKLPTYNEKAGALQTAEQSFKADCADKAYDEIDYFAIQRGK